MSRVRSSGSLPRHLRPVTPRPELQYGVAYYPEHWTAAERRRDIRRMRAAGVKVVRMGEFAWDVWEPAPGKFDFSLFDETITAFARVGIRVYLGMPTAAPPRWLTKAHPDILRETAAGQRLDHGARQHANTAHPTFRAASRAITTALARHYARNPHVAGWQLDNELHCICSTDFSTETAKQFQLWLADRYGRIDRLNRAWGTGFSAGRYDGFDEVPLPLRNRPDGLAPHPAHLLAFYRFTSDTSCSFLAEQAAILRAANPRWFIFHNGLFNHLDYWKLLGSVDAVGIDLYPGFGGEGRAAQGWTSFKLELARAHGGSFLVPELATGAGGAKDFFLENPPPGQMRLWAWNAVAHGADFILHFRWRTCRFGQEIHWHGILDHDDVPRRRLRELTGEFAEFRRLAPVIAGLPRDIRIGVLVDTDQDDAHSVILDKFPAPKHQAEQLVAALFAAHLPAGAVHARDSLAGLEAVIVPSFGYIADSLAEKLEAFARDGGTVICTTRCGQRDEEGKALAVSAPGPLRRLLGVTSEEFGGFRSPRVRIVTEAGVIPAPVGYEIFRTRSARVRATWAPIGTEPHGSTGQPAITENRFGRGRTFAVGTWVTAENATSLVAWLQAELGWLPLAAAGPDVVITRRHSAARTLLFLANHSAYSQHVDDLPAGTELLTGSRVRGTLTLPAYGVAVIRELNGGARPLGGLKHVRRKEDPSQPARRSGSTN